MNTTRARTLLASPVVKHLSSAAVAGAVVLVRPGRIPTPLRRGLLATNTAGSATAMLVGSSTPSARATGPAPLAERVGPNADAIGDLGTMLASLAGSVTLLSSKPLIRLDARIERALLRKGVAHPRLLMAVGAAGTVVVLGILTERIAKAAERKALELQQQQDDPRHVASRVNPPVGGPASDEDR